VSVAAAVPAEPAFPQEHYAAALRRDLPDHVFRRVPRRALWLPAHYAVIAGCAAVVVAPWPAWVKLLAAVVMGCSQGILGFLGHEIMHGTVVRGGRAILVLGGLCMLHWGMHPAGWITWHNRTHHRHTQHGYYDPDTFGWLHMYRRSRWYRLLERLTPGSGTVISYAFLFYWFSFQVAATVFLRPDVIKDAGERRRCRAYLVIVLAAWALVAAGAAPYGLVFLMLVPLAASNFTMMIYVATNHFLNPLTEEVNDPLRNSLTVRSHRLVEFLHLHNNFHVEHHVLPGVNPVHAPRVARALQARWGPRYHAMGHLEALRRVYATPRFYAEETVVKASPESIRPESDLTQLGMTSVDLIRLVVALEKRFGIEILQEEAAAITSVNDLADFLCRKVPGLTVGR
jgi:acyl carrier protein